MNTQSKEVNLLKRIKTADGWYFFPAALTAKGYVRSDVVLVKGNQERHSEGMYYIEFRENGKRIRQAAGKDAEEAHERRLAKEAEFAARNAGVPVLAQVRGSRTSLTAAIAAYLEETKLTKKPKTLAAYSTALQYFQESCHKFYVQEIERKDLLKFIAFLRDEKEQSPRSCYNKFENLMTFLKAQGIRGLVGKNDWPRFVEEEPEIYEQEELDALFAVCNEQERVWFEFFLMTGVREQEAMYMYWSDVNLNHQTVKVTHKPDRNWTPKAYKEREIPIPDKLVQRLKTWKATRDDKRCNLLFPTSGCNVKLDFLDCLKAVAKRAGLNPTDCWLHKFRATYATTLLQSGVDLRTVQSYLGHSDMESTARYLKPARNSATVVKLNGIWKN